MTFKKSVFVLFAILLLGMPLKANAQSFEGIIYFEVPEMVDEGMKEMPYMVKDSKARITINNAAQKATMLFLPDESKLVIIMDQMKSYMTINYEEDLPEDGSATDMTANNTGETKTIAGKSCDVWMMKSSHGNFKTCISKELGTFIMPESSSFKRNSPAWAKQISEGMPLEVLQINEDGTETLKMRATRIEEKSLDPALFKIPEGYRDMSGVMQGMMEQYKN